MKKGASKNKGNAYERRISKELSLWWTEGKRDDIFWLTSLSGGRSTVRRKVGKSTANQAGDITFTDPIGLPLIEYFVLELKKGYTNKISILDFMDKKRGKPILMEWWDKLEEERKEAGRPACMLLFERNAKHTCIMLKISLLREIELMCGTFNQMIRTTYKDTCIIRYDEFLGKVNPDFFGANNI